MTRTLREIEVKIPIVDTSGLIAKLGQMNATCEGRVFEQNSLYDTPGDDYRRRGRLLRLRIKRPAPIDHLAGGRQQAVITSKAPAPASGSRYKERLERELVVSAPRRWPARFVSLGFRQGFCYERYRTTFRLPGLHLEVDQTPIGTFLELEGVPRAIDRAARALGFSPRDYLQSTYGDLFQAERRRRRLSAKNMRFLRKKFRQPALLP